jgi:hypothetical protein
MPPIAAPAATPTSEPFLPGLPLPEGCEMLSFLAVSSAALSTLVAWLLSVAMYSSPLEVRRSAARAWTGHGDGDAPAVSNRAAILRRSGPPYKPLKHPTLPCAITCGRLLAQQPAPRTWCGAASTSLATRRLSSLVVTCSAGMLPFSCMATVPIRKKPSPLNCLAVLVVSCPARPSPAGGSSTQVGLVSNEGECGAAGTRAALIRLNGQGCKPGDPLGRPLNRVVSPAHIPLAATLTPWQIARHSCW